MIVRRWLGVWLAVVLVATASQAAAAPPMVRAGAGEAARARHDPGHDTLSGASARRYARAFAAAEAGHWSRAHELARTGDVALLDKALDWLELVERPLTRGHDALARFAAVNRDWPRARQLARFAEELMPAGLAPAGVIAYFRTTPPFTDDGRLRLAEALLAAGDPEGPAALRTAWIDGNYARREVVRLARAYRRVLGRAEHWARTERLLWDRRLDDVGAMIPYIDGEKRALAEARIALMRDRGGVDAAIARVPAALRGDPGLVFDRMRWRRLKGRNADARILLTTAGAPVGRPEVWWTERHILARDALAEGLISEAYRLAAGHGQTDGLALLEAEWLAGWIALRFLRDHGLAYRHFAALHQAAAMPISRARGAYWAARALAPNDPEQADNWYREAAAHRTTFYGQLAADAIGLAALPALSPPPPADGAARVQFERSELVRVARLLRSIGAHKLAGAFVDRLIENARSGGEYTLVAEMAMEMGRLDLAVRTAKRATQAGIDLGRLGYPTLDPLPGGVAPSLVLAIIRQESAFDLRAQSSAGARGLMQLMPATARETSKALKLGYSRDRLTEDTHYNLTLGTTHLSELVARFDGSVVLSLAAYNAGAARARQWVGTFGDPRDKAVDAIDWIESIPYGETRNYVQRVLENMYIYRQILDPGARPRLTREIRDAPVELAETH